MIVPALKVTPTQPKWTRLCVPPTNESRESVTNFVRAEMADLPGDLCEQLSLAADELLGNSIEHGSRGDPLSDIDFTFVRTARMILFHIKDHGPGFSLESIAHAAVSNPPEEPLRHTQYRSQMGMRPGGFGILLVQKIADELIYNETGNEVLLVKYLDISGDGHS